MMDSINQSAPSAGIDSKVQQHEDKQASSEPVKALVGNTPREIKIANKDQLIKINLQLTDDGAAELTVTKEKIPKKSLKERSVAKYHAAKNKMGQAYTWSKEKTGALNEKRKAFQSASAHKLKKAGGVVAHGSAVALKGAGGFAKNKLVNSGHALKKGYAAAKSGVKQWSADKKGVTLSVAKTIAKGTKNQTVKKAKALKNYTVTKASTTASKLGSLKARFKTESYDLVKAERSLNKRKCTPAVQLKTSTLPADSPLKKALKADKSE